MNEQETINDNTQHVERPISSRIHGTTRNIMAQMTTTRIHTGHNGTGNTMIGKNNGTIKRRDYIDVKYHHLAYHKGNKTFMIRKITRNGKYADLCTNSNPKPNNIVLTRRLVQLPLHANTPEHPCLSSRPKKLCRTASSLSFPTRLQQQKTRGHHGMKKNFQTWSDTL